MRLLPILLGLAMMPLASAANAQAPAPAGPLHIATYVEVAPASAAAGAKLLRDYRDAARKEPGNQRVEVAQEMGRKNRFVVLEIWQDQAAFDAHRKAAA